MIMSINIILECRIILIALVSALYDGSIELINKVHFMVNHQNKKGKLKGFDCISFKCSSKLEYPLEINKQIIDELFDTSKKDDSFNPLNMIYIKNL